MIVRHFQSTIDNRQSEESEDCELLPQTPCGEYHVLTLRLNRAWLRRLRLERNLCLVLTPTRNFLSKQDDNQKRERLNEALVLQEELEQAVTSCPDAGAETKLRLLSFLRNEIEALQRELEASIPFITLHEESDVE